MSMNKKDHLTENSQTETLQVDDFFDFNVSAGTPNTNVNQVYLNDHR